MLSLLSHAVVHLPKDLPVQGAVAGAKTLLHKCLSQFNRQQQIHAQQAVCYVLGLGDGISSHSTVAMLSSVLIAYLKDTVPRTSVAVAPAFAGSWLKTVTSYSRA